MQTRTPSSHWADQWQSSWDRLEETFIPNREQKLSALVDVLEATADAGPTVVDLACGTGSVTLRLLDRLPAARSIALDVDPVLIKIAEATFADERRVRVVRADLRGDRWMDALPDGEVDAVLTATALHWLSESVVRRLYADLSGLLRPGGLFAHLEVMPLQDAPTLGHALADFAWKRHHHEHPNRTSWDAWWDAAAGDPLLAAAVSERNAVFTSNYPDEEFSPPADWHVKTLRDAGFAEAEVVWRTGSTAIVAAVR